MILSVILDRTLEEQKLWEVITMEHFLNGVYQRTGEGGITCLSGGTGLSETVIRRELKVLLKDGVIRRYLHDPVHSLYAYGPNLPMMMQKYGRLPLRMIPQRMRAKAETEPVFGTYIGYSAVEAEAIIQNAHRTDAEFSPHLEDRQAPPSSDSISQ